MDFPDKEALRLADERFLPWVQYKLARDEYVHWFAQDEQGRIVAGGGAWLMEWPPHAIDQSGRRANILNVYTDPAHRRQGLAKRITQAILEHCRGLGIRTFILHASAEGRGVYAALGFKPTNEMRMQL
jgi:GNAT superfamily N-acetyltransferase